MQPKFEVNISSFYLSMVPVDRINFSIDIFFMQDMPLDILNIDYDAKSSKIEYSGDIFSAGNTPIIKTFSTQL
jgi:hypothetical protein